MKKRLLCLGLLVAVSQLFATGCHPVQRWRANHPCGACGPCGMGAQKHPLLHPVQTRQAAHGNMLAGPMVGPVMTAPPCHGCGGGPTVPGYPVSMSGSPGAVFPVTQQGNGYPPIISYPMPITPGPTVIPSHELPSPMPVPKTGTNP
jgi:hypothetical protein